MTVRTPLDRVSAYAEEVRAHLADLGPEQVDDLTDGLEADLAEALADSLGPVSPFGADAPPGTEDVPGAGDLTRRFGPAADYAAELRAAAGMAAGQAHGTRTRRLGATRTRLRTVRARVRAALARREVAAVLELLRPVWWGARGWAWYVVAVAVGSTFAVAGGSQPYVPGNLLGWSFLLALLAVSAWGGRRRDWSRRWARPAFLAASIVAALTLAIAVPAMRTAIEHGARAASTGAPADVPDGIWIGGEPVGNLFAYDADGDLLTDVQLFDDRGRPVTTGQQHSNEVWLADFGEWWTLAPRQDVDRRTRWNVFPLRGTPGAPWIRDEEGRQVLPEGSVTRVLPAPFPLAPALVLPDMEEEATENLATEDPATELSADPAP